jgi:hypothetical protein
MQIATDKLLHFSIAYGATMTVCLFNRWFVGLVALACVGKEVYDWFKYGSKLGWNMFLPMTVGDLVADGLGIGIAIILGGIK